MAWFEKNTSGKKTPESAPETNPQSAKTAAERPGPPAGAEPKVAVKIEQAAPSPVPPGLVGYLYKGSRASGQLSFQGPARIDGIVDGEIHCQGPLTIGESAEIKAKITAEQVVIHGKVEGNVSAKEKIELIAPARVIGNIDAPKLVITEGVLFDGDCCMGVAKQKGGVADSRSVVAEAPVAQSAKS